MTWWVVFFLDLCTRNILPILKHAHVLLFVCSFSLLTVNPCVFCLATIDVLLPFLSQADKPSVCQLPTHVLQHYYLRGFFSCFVWVWLLFLCACPNYKRKGCRNSWENGRACHGSVSCPPHICKFSSVSSQVGNKGYPKSSICSYLVAKIFHVVCSRTYICSNWVAVIWLTI